VADEQSARDKTLSGEVWNEFCDLLKSAGQLVLDNSAEDELERAEGFRYLARQALNGLRSSIDSPPLAAPAFNYDAPRIGCDNPDFLYGSCRITGRASYRVRGRLNDAHNFSIGAHHGRLGSAEGLQSSGFLARGDLDLSEDGSFEIVVGVEQPAAAANFLPLVEESNSLIVRQTILRPGTDVPAELDIEILGGDLTTPRAVLTADRLQNGLGMSALMVHGIVQQFIGWTNDFKSRPNTISEINPDLLGLARGDPNCQYNYGYFDLGEGEALLVTLDPPGCDYWNIQLANHWLESLDDRDGVLSINPANAAADADGRVTVVIAARDPGRPNWLDTQGHSRGVIALRWVGAGGKQPDPVTEVRKLS
jgi:hypothetical protein